MSPRIQDIIASAVMGLFAAVVFQWAFMAHDREKWQSEAVKHHAARWVPDENGHPVFKWEDELEQKR